jgi:signal transduction histidine kinase
MFRLVSDLLAMQAIEEGRFFLKKEMFDLADPVSAAVRGHQSMAGRKQIILEIDCPVETAVIQADRGATLQVMNNLISNAIKFSPPGREVSVRVRVEGGMSVVEVQDQGPGISAEDRSHLFEKFARLSARPTAGESSTGLGLSIVKRLVESMGGTVDCRSAPGEGATFVLRFASVPLTEIEPREKPEALADLPRA